jgi:integrase
MRQPLSEAARTPPLRAMAGRLPTVEQTVLAMLHHHTLDWSNTHRRNVRHYLMSGRFPAWCADVGIATIDQLTTDQVANFLAIQKELLSPATVTKFRQHLRTLGQFCNATPGYGSALNDITRIPAVKMPKRRKYTMGFAWTRNEEDRVVGACNSARDRLLVELMLATGVRVSEVAALHLEDMLLDARPPRVHVQRSVHNPDMTKNGEDRTTGFRKKYASLPRRLEAWIAAERDPHGAVAHREVFLSETTGGPLTVWGVEQLFQRLQAKTGIRCHPHKTRHTWATRCAEDGIAATHLMTMGGWTSLAMVLRYYTADEEEALAALDRVPD